MDKALRLGPFGVVYSKKILKAHGNQKENISFPQICSDSEWQRQDENAGTTQFIRIPYT